MKFHQFASILLTLTLSTLTNALSPVGTACTVDSECETRLCNSPYTGPGGRQCISRPAPNTARCDKSLEATDCDSGYCGDDGLCTIRPVVGETGKPKTDGDHCSNDAECISKICEQPDANGKVCLAANLPIAYGCSFGRQCVENYCPSPAYQCRPASERPDAVTGKKAQDEQCSADPECDSGICDDKIDNDGYKKVCLMGPNLPRGLACSTDRQCSTGYCVPQGTSTESLTCRDKPTGSGSGSGTGTGTGTGTDTTTGGTGTGTGTGTGDTGTGGTGSSGSSSGSGSGSSSGSGSGSGSGSSGSGSGGGSGGSGSGSGNNIVTVTSVSAGRTIVVTSTQAAASSSSSQRASSAASASRQPGRGHTWVGAIVLSGFGITLGMWLI